MFGLTPLGIIHTLISLVALIAGVIALFRDKEISPRTSAGLLYVVTTVLTCLTSFGIFQHRGFGKPHALGFITLLVLALASMASKTSLFGRQSRAVEVVSYSATMFFHLVPAVTETLTRLPYGAPLLDSPDAPALQAISGVMLLILIVGASWQVRLLRRTA